MLSIKSVRKFRQINRKPGTHEYLAKEIHFEEMEGGSFRTVLILDDGTRVEHHLVDAKIYELNFNGFDIISKGKDGVEIKRGMFLGIGKSDSFEEIVEGASQIEDRSTSMNLETSCGTIER